MLIAALFSIAKTCRQPKFILTEEWIQTLWYIYMMDYYSVIKKEWNDAICSNMDGHIDYHTKWSKSARRQWHPTPVLLPGKSHGWRSLVGCIPWGHQESDMTEQLHLHVHALEKEMATHSSVLAWRIPGTGGVWWAAVYCVAQSRTRLKWLNSSSSRSKLETNIIWCCLYIETLKHDKKMNLFAKETYADFENKFMSIKG